MGTEGTKFLLDMFHNRLTGFVLFLRGYVSVKIQSLCPEVSLTELSLLQVQDPASFIKLFMRKHVQCRSRRCVLDLLHSLLRKTFLRDVLDTFHIQLLALRYWYMHNLFNGVLLHTLKFLLLGRDLFLMDLVVHGRRRHVHGRKKSFHDRRNKIVCARCAPQLPQEQVSHGAAKVSAGASATNSTLEESAAQETEGTSMISGIN